MSTAIIAYWAYPPQQGLCPARPRRKAPRRPQLREISCRLGRQQPHSSGPTKRSSGPRTVCGCDLLRIARQEVVARPDVQMMATPQSIESTKGLPILWLVPPCIAFGLVLMTIADNHNRSSASTSSNLYWLGLALMFAACACSVVSRSASASQRLAALLSLSVGLYLVNVIQSPTAFLFRDEFGWLNQIEWTMVTRHLFHSNPLVPNFTSYPGLTIVSTVIKQLGRVSTFTAATIALSLVKISSTALLFAVFLRITKSGRGAALATLIYVFNPSFTQLDSLLFYETLAIPLAIACIWLIVQSATGASNGRTINALAPSILILGLVATHHITTYILIGILAVWLIAGMLDSKRKAAEPRFVVAIVLVIGLVATALWLGVVAYGTTARELGPVFGPAIRSLYRLVVGQEHSRHLFQSVGAVSDPLWLRLCSYLSVLILLGGLATWLLRWRRVTRSRGTLFVVLCVLALAYPVTLAMRLTTEGIEVSQRASEWLFMGLGSCFAGVLITPLRQRSMLLRRHSMENIWNRFARKWPGLVVGVVALVMVGLGGIVVGTAPYSRLSGAFLPGADPRSVDSAGVASALWASHHLASKSRIASDLTDSELLAGYTLTTPVSGVVGSFNISQLYTSQTFDRADKNIFKSGHIGYIVIDQRIRLLPSPSAQYFSSGLIFANQKAFTYASLNKYATSPEFSKIFDDGPVAIYKYIGSNPTK